VITSDQVGLALHFAAVVAGVAAHLALGAIRRPSTAKGFRPAGQQSAKMFR
jgi:hypothetical protein